MSGALADQPGKPFAPSNDATRATMPSAVTLITAPCAGIATKVRDGIKIPIAAFEQSRPRHAGKASQTGERCEPARWTKLKDGAGVHRGIIRCAIKIPIACLNQADRPGAVASTEGMQGRERGVGVRLGSGKIRQHDE